EERTVAVAARQRGEERDGRGHFSWLAKATDAGRFRELRLCLRHRDVVLLGERLEPRLEPLGLDEARVDRVDADAVLHTAVRERLRQQPERRVDTAADREVRIPRAAADADDVDDAAAAGDERLPGGP